MSAERVHELLDRYRARARGFDEIAARVTPFSAPDLPPIELPFTSPPSARELEVVGLVSEGFSNKEIATRLFLAEETIKTHLVKVRGKLDARNRAHLVSIAFRRGLIDLRPVHASLYRLAA